MRNAFLDFWDGGGDILLFFGGLILAMLIFGGVMATLDANHAKEMYSVCLESGGTPRDCKDFMP